MLLKRLVPIVVLLALAAAGCGEDDPSIDTGAAAADHNAADVEFAKGMIPHHEQAVEMADMAVARAADPAVKELAAAIKQAQGPEIIAMRGWLAAWGEKAAAAGGHGGDTEATGGHGGDMKTSGGMMSDQEMGELEMASGATFDRLFLTMMVRHHKGAIEMAKTELDEGMYPPAKTLASQITSSQADEIDQMEGLLAAVP